MPTGGVRVVGLKETVRSLEAFGADVTDLKDVMQPVATRAAEFARGHVDSDSGGLAGTVRGNRAKGKAVVTAGRASVRYAGVQNYGWPRRNIPAQDFFGQTDRYMEPVAYGMFQAGVDDLISRKGLG